MSTFEAFKSSDAAHESDLHLNKLNLKGGKMTPDFFESDVDPEEQKDEFCNGVEQGLGSFGHDSSGSGGLGGLGGLGGEYDF